MAINLNLDRLPAVVQGTWSLAIVHHGVKPLYVLRDVVTWFVADFAMVVLSVRFKKGFNSLYRCLNGRGQLIVSGVLWFDMPLVQTFVCRPRIKRINSAYRRLECGPLENETDRQVVNPIRRWHAIPGTVCWTAVE